MHDILKPSALWKIWQKGPSYVISVGGGLGWPWSGSVQGYDSHHV